MDNNKTAFCPKCGRSLRLNANGQIGFCEHHKEWFAVTEGSESEAAAQNERDRRAKIEAKKAAEKKIQAIARRRIILIVVAIAVVLVSVLLFVVKPNWEYSEASSKFDAGAYEEAREAYQALGSYRDSSVRAALCDAFIDLRDGNAGDAAEKLDILAANGDASSTLAEALISVTSDWKTRGMDPRVVLLILDKVEETRAANSQGFEKIKVEAHAALLEDALLDYVEDINGDGSPELIALNNDYTISVYRMEKTDNIEINVANEAASAYAYHFAQEVEEEDIDAAVKCYSTAYSLSQSDVLRAALAAALNARAKSFEQQGRLSEAVEDAGCALELTGKKSEFDYCYDLNLLYCTTGNDSEIAIQRWNDFAESYADQLNLFQSMSRWRADAGILHINRALELSKRQESSCIEEFKAATDLGADVSDSLDTAISQFPEGLTSVSLRIAALELAGDDATRKEQLLNDLNTNIISAISDWESKKIQASEIPVLIKLADDFSVDIADLDRDAIYEKAALAAVGENVQYSFVDWDADGYEDLLVLDSQGALHLWGIGSTWQERSGMDMEMKVSSFIITDESTPVVTAVSDAGNTLLAVTCENNSLRSIFREENICKITQEAENIVFSKSLEGSIERYAQYSYDAVGLDARPIFIGTDWQQSNYPYPETAIEALKRYFEAKAYNIPEEIKLLTASFSTDWFSFEALNTLPDADIPGTVTASGYYYTEEKAYFEVYYRSNRQQIHTWIAMTKGEDEWKLAGAAQTWDGKEDEERNPELPLLCLNQETSDAIEAAGGNRTYRVLVPYAGSLALDWQAGDKASSNDAFKLQIVKDNLTSGSMVSYLLKSNTARQQSKVFYVNAGVYFVTVEALTENDYPYHLTLLHEAMGNIELENNDTIVNGTEIELNTEYRASLQAQGDIDVYQFELVNQSAVSMDFNAAGNGKNQESYNLKVRSIDNGILFTDMAVDGNVQYASTGEVFLSAGKYLLVVSAGKVWNGDPYTFTVNAAPIDSAEAEYNDTIENASAVLVNTDIRGCIGVNGDIDYYRFVIEADAVVQPRFSFAPTENKTKAYTVSILDANQSALEKTDIGGKETDKTFAPVALQAGTYFLRVENPQYIRQEYLLRINTQTVDAVEVEPNETAALSTALSFGQSLTGVLTTKEDVDYYRIVFTEEQTVGLNISYPKTTNTEKVYAIALEQNGKRLWNANATGDSGGMSQTMKFFPGEYYLCVKAGDGWQSTVYAINLTYPNSDYSKAESLLSAGNYEAARDSYEFLGDYEDSRAKKALCEAMLSIESEDYEHAVEILTRLNVPGNAEVARSVANVLLPVATVWQERGLSPQTTLKLVSELETLGLSAVIDASSIVVDAHIAMLEGNRIATVAMDLDGDGYAELAVMDDQYDITVYRMTENGNETIEVDKGICADCAMRLGDAILDSDVENAIACYGYAWMLNRSDEAADALNTAFNRRGTSQMAEEAVRFYMQARTYGLDTSTMTVSDNEDTLFKLTTLQTLPVADYPVEVKITPYIEEETRILAEVVYDSDEKQVRTWIAVAQTEGFSLIGAANTWSSGVDKADVDYTVPILCLNAEHDGIALEKGNSRAYRLLVPYAGRFSILWQAGEKQQENTAYTLSLYGDSMSSNVLISYELQPNPSRQQTREMFVSAGLYYLVVESQMSNAPDYHINLLLNEESDVETEDNGNPVSATGIELNKAYSGSLLTSKDVDFYAFELTKPAAVMVTLNTSGSGGKASLYACAIYAAEDGSKLTEMSVPGNSQINYVGPLYLAEGTYLVEIGKGASWSNEVYSLAVNTSETGSMEAESNDTVESANPIAVNEDIHASIGREGDIDCYAFILEQDSLIQPRLTFAPLDNNSKTYVITVLGSNQQVLEKINIGGKESAKALPPVALKAGQYCIKLENPQYAMQEYTLGIVAQIVDVVEAEPNETAALSTELPLGQTVTSVLTTKEDVDYYKLVFPEDTTVTMRFTFPQSVNTDKAFTLTIEQNGKRQWNAALTGDSGGIEQEAKFPAGEYYLAVKAGDKWLASVYTLKVE